MLQKRAAAKPIGYCIKMKKSNLSGSYTLKRLMTIWKALHPLKGNRDGIWSITVNGNWRITFEFIDGNAYILNYEDYH